MYKPTIWYFDLMQFLLDHVTIRKSVDIIGGLKESMVENVSTNIINQSMLNKLN